MIPSGSDPTIPLATKLPLLRVWVTQHQAVARSTALTSASMLLGVVITKIYLWLSHVSTWRREMDLVLCP
jgi:hypothetical protein